MPHSQGGPLLPTNGILMSSDLHQAFEKGAFTLSKENKIVINSAVKRDSVLQEFKGRVVRPESPFELYSPYLLYIDEHRKTLFDTYKP